MEIVENTLPCEIDDVLDRPLFCFLGTLSATGEPRVSPLWYLWEDEQLWIVADTEKTYVERVERDPSVAVAVVDTDPRTGLVQHVGMRGTATVEPLDEERVDRLLARYLGEDRARWDDRFADLPAERWRLLRIEPETIVARDQSYETPLDDESGDER